MKMNSKLVATAVALAAFWVMSVSVPAQDVHITEIMSQSGTGGTADWFELTNYGLTIASISGWRMDDNSYAFANSVLLSGVTSLAPGESVVFLESAAGAGIADFQTFWGGVAAVQIGYYSGSGISFGAGGDGLILYDSGGAVQASNSFGAATTGASFYFQYDSAGTRLPFPIPPWSARSACWTDKRPIPRPTRLGNVGLARHRDQRHPRARHRGAARPRRGVDSGPETPPKPSAVLIRKRVQRRRASGSLSLAVLGFAEPHR